jgi:hypothetical protein
MLRSGSPGDQAYALFLRRSTAVDPARRERLNVACRREAAIADRVRGRGSWADAGSCHESVPKAPFSAEAAVSPGRSERGNASQEGKCAAEAPAPRPRPDRPCDARGKGLAGRPARRSVAGRRDHPARPGRGADRGFAQALRAEACGSRSTSIHKVNWRGCGGAAGGSATETRRRPRRKTPHPSPTAVYARDVNPLSCCIVAAPERPLPPHPSSASPVGSSRTGKAIRVAKRNRRFSAVLGVEIAPGKPGRRRICLCSHLGEAGIYFRAPDKRG